MDKKVTPTDTAEIVKAINGLTPWSCPAFAFGLMFLVTAFGIKSELGACAIWLREICRRLDRLADK